MIKNHGAIAGPLNRASVTMLREFTYKDFEEASAKVPLTNRDTTASWLLKPISINGPVSWRHSTNLKFVTH
jgi:hypothetical protein